MTLPFGTAAVSVGLGGHALTRRDQPGAVWTGIGTGSHLVAILLTAGYHVPRYDRLAAFESSSREAAAY